MVYSVDIYDKKGKVVSTVDLNEDIFADGNVNESLIHEYVILQASNARHNIACTKGRGEIAGSGRKIFKQKGTGNARAGDRNSPVRKGGGVAFGPRGERNFEKAMNKKARRNALMGIITLKAKDKALLGLKDFDLTEPKTKDLLDIVKNIGIEGKKALFVLGSKNQNIEKSLRNIANVKYITVGYLNPLDVMSASKVVFFETALQAINSK
ncbi:50S ribosomal protein L4 [candidate division SR1 bacterium RAAC1_SR1_1]|nr:50S ribosomal protein L4 [candidate division SR1 bacterium RAAC1_SR1_1]